MKKLISAILTATIIATVLVNTLMKMITNVFTIKDPWLKRGYVRNNDYILN